MSKSKSSPAFIAPLVTDIDYKDECLFYARTLAELCGELNVNDTNSPGGKRTTRIYTLMTVDIKGCSVAFEFWGPNAEKAERYFRYGISSYKFSNSTSIKTVYRLQQRANHEPEGTVYSLPTVTPGKLQCIEATPTAYQANLLHVHRKFVVGTADGSPKRDLILTTAAMPKPVNFVGGRFKVNGVLLPEPCEWFTLAASEPSDGFDDKAEVLSCNDFLACKRPRTDF